MTLSHGDYIEGFRIEKNYMEVAYTRGWIVSISYNKKGRYEQIIINEDASHILDKYWPDKSVPLDDTLVKKMVTEDSVEIVVGDRRYPFKKVEYQEHWGMRSNRVRDHIEAMEWKIEEIPYYLDKTLLKIKGTYKVFALNGVLQVPNSEYEDIYEDGVFFKRPIEKMIRYIEKYSQEDRRALIVKTNIEFTSELKEYLHENVHSKIMDLFDEVIRVKDYDEKVGKLNELAYLENPDKDVVLIDSDIKLVSDIQNKELYDLPVYQATNLKAVHSSVFMDFKV